MIQINRKIGIWIITGLLIILVVFSWKLQPTMEPFYFSIRTEAGSEKIAPWKNTNGDCYVFLPGYAQLESVFLVTGADTEIVLNDRSVYDGMSCEEFDYDVPYNMVYRFFGRKVNSRIIFMRSGGVATMFLDTASGNMKYIHKSKENNESASGRLYEVDGRRNSSVEQMSISGRGNATWTNHEKKPYTLDLLQETDFLGMGKASKWILLANAADYSHMRNKIVYDFSSEIGLPYTPESRWIDIYLNGEYAGLYLLSEKNEVHTERVDIVADNSYLVSIELQERLDTQGLPYIRTQSSRAMRVHYPQNLQQETLSFISEQWQSVENAILSDDGVDPVSGRPFGEMADISSWVRYYLIGEVFGNLDAFISSSFFYFDSANDDKIYAGPVWDFDKALGNDTDVYWSITNPDVHVLNRYKFDPLSAFIWPEELYEKLWFQKELKTTFETEMLPAVDCLLNTKIEEYANLVRPAAQMDRIRWLSEEPGSFDGAVSQVATYLEEHTEFLKDVWINGSNYCQISFLNVGCDQFYTVPYGGILAELPVIEDREDERFAGWYYSDTGEPFDITAPITEDIEIHAKWEDKPSKKLGQIVKLLPLGMIAIVGCGLLVADIRKSQRS